jgi:hypothetical protein
MTAAETGLLPPILAADSSGFYNMCPLLVMRNRISRFMYPVHNRYDVPLEYTRREVEFTGWCDLAANPLDASDFLWRPHLRRGSVMLIGRDVHLNVERYFYLEAIQGMHLPSWRLGLRSDPWEEPRLFGPTFRPTLSDQQDMLETIEEFARASRSRDQLVCVPVVAIVS